MMNTLYYLSVYVHILAAALWIGGMGFLVLAIVPVLRTPKFAVQAAALVHETGMRFRSLGWWCLGILFVTGGFNMYVRGLRWGDLFADGADPVTKALGYKLLAFSIMVLVSAVHDFWVGPRATSLWQAQPDSPAAGKARKQAAKLGRVTGFLALVILYFAIRLVRGGVG